MRWDNGPRKKILPYFAARPALLKRKLKSNERDIAGKWQKWMKERIEISAEIYGQGEHSWRPNDQPQSYATIYYAGPFHVARGLLKSRGSSRACLEERDVRHHLGSRRETRAQYAINGDAVCAGGRRGRKRQTPTRVSDGPQARLSLVSQSSVRAEGRFIVTVQCECEDHG